MAGEAHLLRLGSVPNGADATTATRGRCANHPGVASVAACELCGRWLCVVCAVPVRGRVIGPECLASVVEDAPPALPPAAMGRRGDRLAIAGFALVTVLSIFPWSRFGDSSRFFGAWTLHWSIVAVTAGVVGLVFALSVWRRPIHQLAEAGIEAGLAGTVAAAALLHHHHPPPLTVGSAAPWLAVAGATVALAGALVKAATVLRARRGLP